MTERTRRIAPAVPHASESAARLGPPPYKVGLDSTGAADPISMHLVGVASAMNVQSPSKITADVAIVGGGVAGSSLAATLARAGFGAVVVERETRFRDRVRGESMHPWGVREADRLGLLPVLHAAGAVELPRWQRYDDRVPREPYRWADDTPGGYGEWTIFHPAMQEALLRHAANCGARVLRPARAVAVQPEPQPTLAVETDGAPLEVRARLIVGADGSRSAVRHWLGIAVHTDPVHHAIGGCLLDGVALDEAAAHQAYFPGGMAMIFPQGGGRARAYVVCGTEDAERYRGAQSPAAFIATCAAALPDGALATARPRGPAAFFPNADVWPERIAAGSAVLVGDAAGANDPSQGHGLSLAFRDVRELRDLLLGSRDWRSAIVAYAARRTTYFAVFRALAQWGGILSFEQGPAAEARRERVARAREADPSAGGLAAIFALGPDGLVADGAARRHFFGEDIGAD